VTGETVVIERATMRALLRKCGTGARLAVATDAAQIPRWATRVASR
jgi:hypothetical protein